MDVFDFRDRLIDDYSKYVRSFIKIRDEKVADYVDGELHGGKLWPQPLLQLNPNFRPGGTMDELVEEGLLHPGCADVFRVGKSADEPRGKPLHLHKHQSEAIRIALGGHNFVVTTGTGSGKSLTYIIPIIDHVLKHGSGNGIKAIVVYPMNALANSQEEELGKFLLPGFPDGPPVTYKRYTGQETREERDEIIANPPDIILTNYVMLELVLTRPHERKLIEAAKGLQFLVFDELHTYRGRQGADVAMLIRRVRERLSTGKLQCIGTSATMSTEGTYDDRQKVVGKVASRVFGDEVHPDHVVGESLQRTTDAATFDEPGMRSALTERVTNPDALLAKSFEAFVADPFCAWLEDTFGLEQEEGTGRLVRAQPIDVLGENGAASRLARLTGLEIEECADAIQRVLLAGYQKRDPNDRPAFAFRLHQFISKGDAIYASMKDASERKLTLEGQQYVPGSDRSELLIPLAFCRECGHDYYTVWMHKDPISEEYTGVSMRSLSVRKSEDGLEVPGFLYASVEKPWPDEDSVDEADRLPDDWFEEGSQGPKLKSHYRKYRPKSVLVRPDGTLGAGGKRFQFVPSPFRFCLSCGVFYPGRAGDFSKLNVFSSEGRSTSTTILSLSAVRQLRESNLPAHAQKLLSFTDNRQDAALQSGHFNDFVEVGLLRSALYRAVAEAGETGLGHDTVVQQVFDTLGLKFEEYAADPTVIMGARRQTDEALREVLGYRLYQDLKRGWRLTAPNLEQVGLLRIEYLDLPELSQRDEYWQDYHPALATAPAEVREHIAGVLLDVLRRQLAIKSPYLDPGFQETLKNRSYQRLAGSWSLEPRAKLERASVLYPRSKGPNDYGDKTFLSGRSGFGRFLRRGKTLSHWNETPGVDETERIILDLLSLLKRAGLVSEVDEPKKPGEVPGYQVNAASMRWVAGDGTPVHDPLRTVSPPSDEQEANEFFSEFYRVTAQHLHGVRSAEHTAQVSSEEREEREHQFRDARLPVLYCSPTMELGVDIAALNVVNMRNVPPTPANYAQRSGRAGRSGQPALVFTYASTWNSHDQYFFKRKEKMVGGAVATPRLDLANEDLLRSHVQAVWLSETGVNLGQSLVDVLEVDIGEGLPLKESVEADLKSQRAAVRARERADAIMASVRPLLGDVSWHHDEWLDETLGAVRNRFDAACDRWRDLYRAAHEQVEVQTKVRLDQSRRQDHRAADRLRREAESQLDLLVGGRYGVHSDFYSYRYFASEGFLPGYSFPRLPLSAFVPGQQARGSDEYLSRPRFLAITEFGPRAFIYHNGGKYQVNRVILPPSARDERGATTVVKRCETCGYMHVVMEGEGPDLCENCGSRLGIPMRQMLRMNSVTTKRVERINSDEEERQRLGYEVITGYRFSEDAGEQNSINATLTLDGEEIATVAYGNAATIWRVNLGWRHRENAHQHGFVLDLERGYWQSDKALQEQELETLEADEDPLSQSLQRVIPFVEDRRNCLVWSPKVEMSIEQMATLQAALKNAIQVEYQLEDSELAAEPLPSDVDRQQILFYEAAEGGAGVLERLLGDRDALQKVARQALELCHFDPDTGENLQRGPHASDDCEAACYDCLMSYGNQRDHLRLDRHLLVDQLMDLTKVDVQVSAGPKPRHEHLAELKKRTDSQLEVAWLKALDERDLRLPSAAQKRLEVNGEVTKPDFMYEDAYVVIYIDGPVHDYRDRQDRDEKLTSKLEDGGYTVIRFGDQDDWGERFKQYNWVFGGTE